MLQHILFCNNTAEAWVLDLPASIADAQLSSRQLRSVAALETPFDTPEPKGAKRQRLLLSIPAAERAYHQSIQQLLVPTLQSVQDVYSDPSWCLPRVLGTACGPQSNASCDSKNINHEALNSIQPPLILSPEINHVYCLAFLDKVVVHNPFHAATSLAVSTRIVLTVPPKCTFLCAAIEDGLSALEIGVSCLLSRKCFDLVLLDPPWSNRSVRRSMTYRTEENQTLGPFEQTLPILSTLTASKAYTAIWITNKATIRAKVVSACASLGFVLVEEWIWLKVTATGVPVTPIDGIWRKPYEILLIFQRDVQPVPVQRKVLMTVPDLHSRKPSLKVLLERLLPENHNVLELFARSLTAGWWSFGNEVLKFQHENEWY